jgi:hypothetical protein
MPHLSLVGGCQVVKVPLQLAGKQVWLQDRAQVCLLLAWVSAEKRLGGCEVGEAAGAALATGLSRLLGQGSSRKSYDVTDKVKMDNDARGQLLERVAAQQGHRPSHSPTLPRIETGYQMSRKKVTKSHHLIRDLRLVADESDAKVLASALDALAAGVLAGLIRVSARFTGH